MQKEKETRRVSDKENNYSAADALRDADIARTQVAARVLAPVSPLTRAIEMAGPALLVAAIALAPGRNALGLPLCMVLGCCALVLAVVRRRRETGIDPSLRAVGASGWLLLAGWAALLLVIYLVALAVGLGWYSWSTVGAGLGLVILAGVSTLAFSILFDRTLARRMSAAARP